MHLALVIYGTLDTLSGGYLYDRKLVEHLRANGHTVEIVSLPWRSYREHLTDNFSAPLLQKLINPAFDLILQDELNHPSLAWLNKQVKKHVSTPIVSIVHHLRCDEDWGLMKRLIFRRVEKDYLKTVDRFVFNSETTRKSVERLIGRSSAHVVGYPAGDRFKNEVDAFTLTRDDRSGKLKMIFVGNLIERKGLDVLLMALRQLPANKWELDVVGDPQSDPTYAEKLHKFVDEIPRLKANVRFLGRLTDQQLAIRYSLNHLLVVPSSYEGFGIVYLEAMGFGLPAVATTGGAAAEIITHSQNGYLVPVNDPNTLARALRLLINDRDLLVEMSQNAKETIDSFPSWEDTCTKIENFLLETTK